MKTFLISLLLAFSTLTAHADIKGAPFIPEEDKRFNQIEDGSVYQLQAVDGHHAKQVVQATYDFAVQGGSNTLNSGVYDLGVGLPKNAEIVRSYVYSITQPTTSASGTLGFYCKLPAIGYNIKQATAAASYAAAAAAVDGIQTGAASAFSTVTAACNIKAVIGTGALTAGKVTVFVEYVTHK